jgi:4-hydroxy-tetrahydrodipicolinate reductase
MAEAQPRRYRVIQWATGNIGCRALAAALAHPDLDVVGVRVYDPAKVGRDAGSLVGAEPVGVVATDDVDALVATDADCVLHMPSAWDLDELCRLLASGKNVVTTCSELFHPASGLPADVVARLDAACAAGGSSLHGTGSSPGFITEVVPLALLSAQRSLRALEIEEFADLSRRPSPELLFGIMGMGRRPGAVDQRRAGHLGRSFGPSLEALGAAVGLPVEGIEARAEVAVATRSTRIAAGDIDAGCIAAQRTVVAARAGADTRLTFRATWYCTTDLDPAWELAATGWRVTVDGDAPLTVDLAFPIEPDDLAAVTPGYTAHRPVNVVAAVCQAPSGVVSTLDLPAVPLTLLSGG